MNEESWVETIKMRKNRKWKDKKENWRTGKRLLNWKCRREKEEWKTAPREKEGNEKRNWGNHHIGVIGIWSGKGEEEEIEEKEEKN